MKLAKTVLVKVKRFQGRLKKGAFDGTRIVDDVCCLDVLPGRPVLLSRKIVSHIAAALR